MNASPRKRLFLRIIGISFCTVPVITAILTYFPLWREKGGTAVLSGFTLLLTVLALTPLMKTLKRLLRSPAVHTMWFIVFAVFLLLSKIADEMTVISFVGFIGNLIGAFFFKAANKNRGEYNEGQL